MGFSTSPAAGSRVENCWASCVAGSPAQQRGWQQERRQNRRRPARSGTPAARQCGRYCRVAAASSSYRSNPQNVDNPLVLPSPDLSAEACVRVQLEALRKNDQPWSNHGIKTAYAFAFDVGGLDPSMYFGFPKDLYHEDHFQGMFATRLATLVNNRGFTITSVQEQPAADDPPCAMVAVQVQPALMQQPAEFWFHLRRKTVGARKGSLMTWMVTPS